MKNLIFDEIERTASYLKLSINAQEIADVILKNRYTEGEAYFFYPESLSRVESRAVCLYGYPCRRSRSDTQSGLYHVHGNEEARCFLCYHGSGTGADGFSENRCSVRYHRLCSVWACMVAAVQKGAER